MNHKIKNNIKINISSISIMVGIINYKIFNKEIYNLNSSIFTLNIDLNFINYDSENYKVISKSIKHEICNISKYNEIYPN